MGTSLRATRRRSRALEWLARYAPAEVGAVCGALVAALVAEPMGTGATAYAGAVGDGIGFYTVLFVRDLRRQSPGPRRWAAVTTLRGLAIEFGPAEFLDSLVVRPLAMYLATRLLGSATAGVIAGKVAADAVFYAVAVGGYELRRHLHRRRAAPTNGIARTAR